ncbi:MAG: sigma-70 family RNA polymerase sigma factor [Isosphaeraceae bacterium]
MTTDLSDAELARRAGRRDDATTAQAALRSLYDRHSGAVLSWLCSKMDRSAAESVHQAVWAQIWGTLRSEGRFEGERFRAWALQVARNHAPTDHPATPQPTGDDEAGAFETPAATGPFAEVHTTLARCMARLKADEAQVVRARLSGVDSAEIATKAKVPVERVEKLFQQARARLTACVERTR